MLIGREVWRSDIDLHSIVLQEEELRSAIEDAKNALDDSKRRFLLVLMLGGIVVGAASSWATLVMSQTV